VPKKKHLKNLDVYDYNSNFVESNEQLQN